MLSRFRNAVFGLPFLSTAANHTYSGPTTSIAIQAAANSSSSTMPSVAPTSAKYETATVANGCFWGTQHIYDKHFKGKLVKTEVGYTGGKTESPTYRLVCSGTTAHAEACRITFDPAKVSYAELVEFFFRTHDPTQMNGQGPDRGTQYRSAIFYHSPEQKEIAEKVREEIKSKHPLVIQGGKIATEITEAGKWWSAEEYHQEYLENNPGGYECPTHRLWW